MVDLRELYQQVILDHNRAPKNFRALDDPTAVASGDNPLCGDKITLYLRVEDDVIQDIGFQGSGCAISQASASLMTQAVKGKRREDAEALFQSFHSMLTAPQANPPDLQALGKLAALAGVKQFPARVKCANLPWHTLHAALAGRAHAVSTE